MSYNNGKITGAVSFYDVQRALGVSLTDEGALCRSKKVNMWAKYRPIPCLNNDLDGNGNTLNKKTPLSLDDRKRLSYGLRVFYDSSVSSYLWNSFIAAAASSLNAGANINDLAVKPRQWNDPNDPNTQKQWQRITDFVSIPNDDPLRTLGYYHFAKPYYPVWKAVDDGQVEHGTYEIGSPLISETERSRFEILAGSHQTLVLPDDQFYLHAYEGDTFVEGGVTMHVVKQNEDPLSISALDAIINAGNWLASNTQSHDNLSTLSVRGVAILVRAYDSNNGAEIWAPFGSWERSSQSPFNPQGVLDLEAENSNGISSIYLPRRDQGDTYQFYTNPYISAGVTRQQAQWKDLEGYCAFLEYYHDTPGGSYLLPIPGYGYYVNIARVTTPSGTVDYAGKFIEWGFVVYEELGCVLSAAVDFTTVADIASALSGNTYYTSLTLVLSQNVDGSNPVVMKNLKSAEWSQLTIDGTETIDGYLYRSATFVFEESTTLSSGTYYWVLLATKNGGSTSTLVSGVVEI